MRRVLITPFSEAGNLLTDLEHFPRNISPPQAVFTHHGLKLIRFLAPLPGTPPPLRNTYTIHLRNVAQVSTSWDSPGYSGSDPQPRSA